MKIKEDEIKRQQVEIESERERHRKQLEELNRIAQQGIANEQRRIAEYQARFQQQEQQRIAEETRQAAIRAQQEAETKALRGIYINSV